MKLFLKFLFAFVVLCLIHKPEFIFIPRSINSSFGLMGFLVWFFNFKYRKIVIGNGQIKLIDYLKFYIPAFLISIFTYLIHINSETYYISYIFSIILAYFGSFLLASLSYKIYGDYTFRIFFKYLLLAEIIYLILSFAMFVNPGVHDLLMSLVRIDEIAESAMQRTEGFRIQGYGASFYGAGLVNGYFLMILAIYLSMYRMSILKTTMMYLLYLIVAAIGMMMARTTIVGAAFGGIIIIMSSKLSIRQWVKKSLTISLVLIIAFQAFDWILRSANFDIDTLYNFAFEMFINYSESGNIETSSTDHMWEMYETLPTTFATWIIGDAKWTAPDGGYYMHVDIGYLRALFYFGIVGVVALFFYYYKSMEVIVCQKRIFGKYSRFVFLMLFCYVLILNLKGPCDLIFYISPFVFVGKKENKILLC